MSTRRPVRLRSGNLNVESVEKLSTAYGVCSLVVAEYCEKHPGVKVEVVIPGKTGPARKRVAQEFMLREHGVKLNTHEADAAMLAKFAHDRLRLNGLGGLTLGIDPSIYTPGIAAWGRNGFANSNSMTTKADDPLHERLLQLYRWLTAEMPDGLVAICIEEPPAYVRR